MGRSCIIIFIIICNHTSHPGPQRYQRRARKQERRDNGVGGGAWRFSVMDHQLCEGVGEGWYVWEWSVFYYFCLIVSVWLTVENLKSLSLTVESLKSSLSPLSQLQTGAELTAHNLEMIVRWATAPSQGNEGLCLTGRLVITLNHHCQNDE